MPNEGSWFLQVCQQYLRRIETRRGKWRRRKKICLFETVSHGMYLLTWSTNRQSSNSSCLRKGFRGLSGAATVPKPTWSERGAASASVSSAPRTTKDHDQRRWRQHQPPPILVEKPENPCTRHTHLGRGGCQMNRWTRRFSQRYPRHLVVTLPPTVY